MDPRLFLCLALGACGAPGRGSAPEPPDAGAEGEGESEGEGEARAEGEGEGEGEGEEPSGRCVTPEPWKPGEPAFRDVTEAWGMTELGVTGIQVNVTDLDGDGWPDLVVHQEGGRDDFDPEGERATWVLRNTGAGRFEDVTRASGFRQRRRDPDGGRYGREGQIMATADIDNDGDLDFFTATIVGDPTAPTDLSEVLLNRGDGTFELGPETSDARRDGLKDHPFSMAFVDIERDGLIDIWLVENGPINPGPLQDELYRGFGDGDFVRATEAAGLLTASWVDIDDFNNARAHSWGWAATACDLTNDGIPELLTASYGRMPNHLWVGSSAEDGAVRYENRALASGYAFDGNQDWTDDHNARCWCLEHPDDAECERAQPAEGQAWCDEHKQGFGGSYRWDHRFSRDPFFTGGVSASTVCIDINNDGHMDLLTGEIVHPDVGGSADHAELLLNTGEPELRLERPGNEVTGLSRDYLPRGIDEGVMNNAAFDFDNDGWQDVYWSVSGYPYNRGHLYRQVAPARFEELAREDYFDHPGSHGVQAVDLDRDGDLDLVVGHLRIYCEEPFRSPCLDTPTTRVYENVVGNGANWVQLALVGGPGSNRAAIGARVTVATGSTTQTQEVDGGHGRFSTQRDLTLHFGLGAECEAEVTVRWPDRPLTTETFRVRAGLRYRVTQGSDPVVAER